MKKVIYIGLGFIFLVLGGCIGNNENGSLDKTTENINNISGQINKKLSTQKKKDKNKKGSQKQNKNNKKFEKCILDICYTFDKSNYSGSVYFNKKISKKNIVTIYKYFSKKNKIYKEIKAGSGYKRPFAGEILTLSKHKGDNLYIKNKIKKEMCADKTIHKVYNNSGSLIQNVEDINSVYIPKTLYVGNLKYSKPKIAKEFSEFKINYEIGGFNLNKDKDIAFLNKNKDITEVVDSIILDISGVKLQYKLDNKWFNEKSSYNMPFNKNYYIVNISSGMKLNGKTKKEGDLYRVTDKNFAKKILKNKWENGNLRSKNKSVEKILSENMYGKKYRIGLLKVSDNSNKYAIISLGDINFVAYAEMCKPAIYVYDKKNRKNKLSLKSKGYHKYTKLIPYFNLKSKNGWNFKPDNGKIKMSDRKYPYLYYSVEVGNYRFNKNGWFVKGKNIKQFFEDKLDYIGFKKQEKKDFMKYWVDKFKTGKVYFVSFKFKDKIDNYIKLNFLKEPTNKIRVLLEAFEIEGDYNKSFLYKNTKNTDHEESILKRYDRGSSFEVFEWGGVLKENNNYIVY